MIPPDLVSRYQQLDAKLTEEIGDCRQDAPLLPLPMADFLGDVSALLRDLWAALEAARELHTQVSEIAADSWNESIDWREKCDAADARAARAEAALQRVDDGFDALVKHQLIDGGVPIREWYLASDVDALIAALARPREQP